jgi:mono/diheme cytochrome c family protein
MVQSKHEVGLLSVGVGALILALFLSIAACGSPSSGGSGADSSPVPSPTPIERASPTSTPTPSSSLPTPTSTRPVSPQEGSASRLARGEEIFQRTAGGVGCQYCHGVNAKGNIGPNIRGKPLESIKLALGTVEQMFFISQTTPLTEEDIEAIAAYLKYLESQP